MRSRYLKPRDDNRTAMKKLNTVSDKTFFERYPTKEAIQRCISHAHGNIKTAREGIAYRMKNYYDCIDDYSSGGICDKAANELIGRCNVAIEVLNKMLTGSRTFTETVRREVLCDLDGNILSDRIVNTRYGRAWMITTYNNERPTWVNVAKRQSTYEKKGYMVMTVESKIEYYYVPRMTHRGLIIQSRILTQTLAEPTESEMKFHCDRMHNLEYFAMNKV